MRCDTVPGIEECAYRLHGEFAFLKLEVLEEDRRHDVSALAIGQTYGCLSGLLAYDGENSELYIHWEAGQAGWKNWLLAQKPDREGAKSSNDISRV